MYASGFRPYLKRASLSFEIPELAPAFHVHFAKNNVHKNRTTTKLPKTHDNAYDPARNIKTTTRQHNASQAERVAFLTGVGLLQLNLIVQCATAQPSCPRNT